MSKSIEIDKDKEIELKKEIDKEKKPVHHKYGTYGWVKLTQDQYNKLVTDYGKQYVENMIQALDEYLQSNGNKNKYKDFNLVMRKALREHWFNVSEHTPDNDDNGGFEVL